MSGLNELGWNDFNILVGKVVKEAERRGTSIYEITRQQAKREFSIGDWVKFEARGRSVIGKIIKINPKNVKVMEFDRERKVPKMRWNCAPQFLTKCEPLAGVI